MSFEILKMSFGMLEELHCSVSPSLAVVSASRLIPSYVTALCQSTFRHE